VSERREGFLRGYALACSECKGGSPDGFREDAEVAWTDESAPVAATGEHEVTGGKHCWHDGECCLCDARQDAPQVAATSGEPMAWVIEYANGCLSEIFDEEHDAVRRLDNMDDPTAHIVALYRAAPLPAAPTEPTP
jgi:hypothetical protein